MAPNPLFHKCVTCDLCAHVCVHVHVLLTRLDSFPPQHVYFQQCIYLLPNSIDLVEQLVCTLHHRDLIHVHVFNFKTGAMSSSQDDDSSFCPSVLFFSEEHLHMSCERTFHNHYAVQPVDSYLLNMQRCIYKKSSSLFFSASLLAFSRFSKSALPISCNLKSSS